MTRAAIEKTAMKSRSVIFYPAKAQSFVIAVASPVPLFGGALEPRFHAGLSIVALRLRDTGGACCGSFCPAFFAVINESFMAASG
jgi:hypothetical protein